MRSRPTCEVRLRRGRDNGLGDTYDLGVEGKVRDPERSIRDKRDMGANAPHIDIVIVAGGSIGQAAWCVSRRLGTVERVVDAGDRGRLAEVSRWRAGRIQPGRRG